MTEELSHLELAEGKDPIEESLKLSLAGGEPAQASWVDIVNKVIYDQLTGKKGARSEFPAVIRGMVDYEEASGFSTSESGVDFSAAFSNTDPFYSSVEDGQRILDGGIVKDFKDKKILFLEVPFFYLPADAHLGDYLWINSLLRMDVTNTKAKRDFVSNELIYITFTDLRNLIGPKFLRFPIEDKKLLITSEHKGKPVIQKHLDGTKKVSG